MVIPYSGEAISRNEREFSIVTIFFISMSELFSYLYLFLEKNGHFVQWRRHSQEMRENNNASKYDNICTSSSKYSLRKYF
jgi:hypothetical protein